MQKPCDQKPCPSWLYQSCQPSGAWDTVWSQNCSLGHWIIMEAQSLHYSWSWAMACWIAKAINMNFLFGEIEIIPPSGSRSFSSGMRLDETESGGHLNCELESWRLGLWSPPRRWQGMWPGRPWKGWLWDLSTVWPPCFSVICLVSK